MSQPMLFVMCGLPYSGKTYVAEKILDKLGADSFYLSTDSFVLSWAHYHNTSYSAAFKEAIGPATDFMYQSLPYHFKENNDLVWDQTNITIKKRKGILSQVPKHYQVCCVYVKANLLSRLGRMRLRPNQTVSMRVQAEMSARFQEPTLDEGFDWIETVENNG